MLSRLLWAVGHFFFLCTLVPAAGSFATSSLLTSTEGIDVTFRKLPIFVRVQVLECGFAARIFRFANDAITVGVIF